MLSACTYCLQLCYLHVQCVTVFGWMPVYTDFIDFDEHLCVNITFDVHLTFVVYVQLIGTSLARQTHLASQRNGCALGSAQTETHVQLIASA